MANLRWEKKRSGKTAVLSYVCRPKENEMACIRRYSWGWRCIGMIDITKEQAKRWNNGSTLMKREVDIVAEFDTAKNKALDMLELVRKEYKLLEG